MQNISFVTRVISNGRVTIPKRVIEVLGISKGDYIEIKIVRIVKKSQEECGVV